MSSIRLTLASSLIPGNVVKNILENKLGDQAVCAISTIALNVAVEAAKMWTQGCLKKGDPNPGDGGCQKRGFLHLCFMG